MVTEECEQKDQATKSHTERLANHGKMRSKHDKKQVHMKSANVAENVVKAVCVEVSRLMVCVRN